MFSWASAASASKVMVLALETSIVPAAVKRVLMLVGDSSGAGMVSHSPKVLICLIL